MTDLRRLPTLFISHGSPMLALTPSPAHHFLRQLGTALPRPQSILVVSAHWESAVAPAVSFAVQPDTYHDFGAFPPPHCLPCAIRLPGHQLRLIASSRCLPPQVSASNPARIVASTMAHGYRYGSCIRRPTSRCCRYRFYTARHRQSMPGSAWRWPHCAAKASSLSARVR